MLVLCLRLGSVWVKECVGGDEVEEGEKNFSNFDSLGHLGKQGGVKRVAIVIEFVKFGC